MYRYQNIQIVKTDSTSDRYYVNNIYPEIPYSENDSYVITVLGDRLDTLAFNFYGDTSLYWVIATANALPGDSIYLDPGSQLRIPSNMMGIINDYKSINVVR
jgi:phage tail protein X